MTTPWPPDIASATGAALGAAAERLSDLDAQVDCYRLDEGGYQPVTARPWSQIYSLEARFGTAHRKPGHSIYGLFQVFDPEQPNLGFMRWVERRDRDGAVTLDRRVPIANGRIDRVLVARFMPVINSALNALDPTGQGRSLYVGCLHGRVSLGHVPGGIRTTVIALEQFRGHGQDATIWVDFHAPWSEFVVRATETVMRRNDVHLIPRTAAGSALHTPLRCPNGTISHIGGMSDAVERGISLARRYLAVPA